jgi:2-polyprenyl-3-methyl-5-hydroxy-6-metoxy-1,4-benzoquinol methylase
MWNPVKRQEAPDSSVVDEHFVPGRGVNLRDAIRKGDARAVHHLIRYEWAARCLADWPVKSLLDLATGSGYGAHGLAARLPSATVTGVDYDEAAIFEALALPPLPNLVYRVGDALRWTGTIGPDLYDAIVSFDMLEHVAHREILMENLVGHLSPHGVLLLSTPCGWAEPLLRPEWVHHHIEYSSASLYDFLRRYFVTIVRPEDTDFPHRDVFDILAGGPVTYLLQMNPLLCRGPIAVENPYR